MVTCSEGLSESTFVVEHQTTSQTQEVVEQLRSRFGNLVYKVVIRENVRVAEAPSFAKPITHYDPRSAGAEDYRALAAAVLQPERRHA